MNHVTPEYGPQKIPNYKYTHTHINFKLHAARPKRQHIIIKLHHHTLNKQSFGVGLATNKFHRRKRLQIKHQTAAKSNKKGPIESH